MNYRKKLANKYLVGQGVEFGALHNPLTVDLSKASVLYADKLSKNKLIENFPELKQDSKNIVDTDIFLNLDKDNYANLLDYKFDFFIANHVIEHLANPIKFLEKLERVMKKDSYLYLAIPDKEYTLDYDRNLTTWNHLYEEYINQTTQVTKEHIEDFIFNVKNPAMEELKDKKKLKKMYKNWFKRIFILRKHRKRSIHVHVWNQQSFNEFLESIITKINLNFKIIDSVTSDETHHEMIYILQKQ